MKTNLLLSASILLVGSFLSFQKSGNSVIDKYNKYKSHKNASGAPTGKTGAPGEVTCTQCHAGTVQSGAGENNFILLNGFSPVTTYLPGTTYNATLTMNSNPSKKGFQAIALDGTNAMAGNFVGQANNTAISTAGTKKYANHTSTSNTSTVSTWIWQWAAPSTNVGNVTFYIASNKANNNGTTTGDIIYVSQHTINIDPSAGIDESGQEEMNFTVGFDPGSNTVHCNFNSLSIGEMYFNLVDLNGRSIFVYDLGQSQVGKNKQSVKLPSDIANGLYAVNFFIGNKAMQGKIFVQR